MINIIKGIFGLLVVAGFFYLPLSIRVYNQKVDKCVNISVKKVYGQMFIGTELYSQVCECSCNQTLLHKITLKQPRDNYERIFLDLKNKKRTQRLPSEVRECVRLSLGKYGYSIEEYRESVKTY